MLLFGVTDETVAGAGAGVVIGGLATLLGLILKDGRGRNAQAAAQWKAYGLAMAKKYEDEVIRNAVADGEKDTKLLKQAEELGQLRAENAALKERLK